jgi:PAS domain S-box-containing protein
MFGVAQPDLVGTVVEQLLPAAARTVHVAHRRRFGERPQRRPMGVGPELHAMHVSGWTFPVEVSLSPIDIDGVTHTIAAIRDVSEREQTSARLEVLEERERIARDLHDMVIQRLFAAGMGLQAVAADAAPPFVAERIEATVGQLDDTITELRAAIFRLGSRPSDRSLRAEVLALVADRAPLPGDGGSGIEPAVTVSGDLDSVSAVVGEQLVATLSEALSNVARHAAASSVAVSIVVDDDRIELVVTDDGVGVGTPAKSGGGLANLMWRAAELGGACSVGPATPRGTVLTWTVPG